MSRDPKLDDKRYLLEHFHEWKDVGLECHDDSRDPKTGKQKNTHKFYVFHVEPNSDKFNIEYGRIGKSPSEMTYPKSLLQKKFLEKLNRGYKVVRVARHDEKSLMFADFVEKYLDGGEEFFLPD